MRAKHGFLHDEQGDRSFSRGALCYVLPFTLLLIAADSSLSWVHVATPAYALLGTLNTFLMVWAGGRAMMRYVGPQLGSVAQGLGGTGPANDGAPGGDLPF